MTIEFSVGEAIVLGVYWFVIHVAAGYGFSAWRSG